MEEKRCIVEFLPDEKFGWVIKPGPGCEETFKEVAEKQGPHAQRYLNIRKVEQPTATTVEQQPIKTPE